MTAPTGRRDEPPRSFSETIEELCGGDLNAHITREFHEMVGAAQTFAGVMNADGKAEITIKIGVKVSPNGECRVAGDVKTKVPKLKPHPGTMFVSAGGNLVTQNQRQPDLPFGEVPRRANREPRDMPAPREPREAKKAAE